MGLEDAVHRTWQKTCEAFAQCFTGCHVDEYDDGQRYGNNDLQSGYDGRQRTYNEKSFGRQPRQHFSDMRPPLPKQHGETSVRYKISAPSNFRHVGGMANYNHGTSERPCPPPPPPPSSEKPSDTIRKPEEEGAVGEKHSEIVSASVLIVRSMNSWKASSAGVIPRKPLNSQSIEDLAEKAAAYIPMTPDEKSRTKEADFVTSDTGLCIAHATPVQQQQNQQQQPPLRTQPPGDADVGLTPRQQHTRSRSKTMPVRFSKHLKLARHKHGMRDAVRELQTIVEELRSERNSPHKELKTPSTSVGGGSKAAYPEPPVDKALIRPSKSLRITTRLPHKHHDLPWSAPPTEAPRFSNKYHRRSISGTSHSIHSSHLYKWLNPAYFFDMDAHDSLLSHGSDMGVEADEIHSIHSSPRTSIISMYSLEKNARRTWAPFTSSSISSLHLPRAPSAAAKRSHSVIIRPLSSTYSPDPSTSSPRRATSAPQPVSPSAVDDVECFAVAMMGVEAFEYTKQEDENGLMRTNVAPLRIAKKE